MGGIVEEFKEHGLRIFGAKSRAAELEGSKSFSKKFMQKHGLKTAEAKVNLNALGSSGYVAGGPKVWIDGANQIIQKK